MNTEISQNFKTEIERELNDLLTWWIANTIDEKNDGFYGAINNHNKVITGAAKGLVLNARILYTFSSAYALTKKEEYLKVSERAFDYIQKYFADDLNGGFYWSVKENGEMLDGKKQVYGQAFVIYAFAEYFKVSQDKNALSSAKKTFDLLEQYSFDKINSGYLEAFTIDWNAIADLRLSNKDQNEKKTMNTHLHVIEAYANLYTVWQSDELKLATKRLLRNFDEHIINKENHHLNLFFTETWEVKSSLVSFGHDIEAAWLLQEAAEIIGDEKETDNFQNIALKMTDASARGLAKNGGLLYEFDLANNHWIKEFHWWPQAEAMVGFYNAWQISKDDQYFNQTISTWNFIKNHLKDYKSGEWFWGVNEDNSIMQAEDKAGFWKCPYHNGRACIEILKRINNSSF